MQLTSLSHELVGRLLVLENNAAQLTVLADVAANAAWRGIAAAFTVASFDFR